MMTAVKGCTGPGATEANRLNWASLAGKMDFAHLHGFELWLHGEKVPLESSSLLAHMRPPAHPPTGVSLMVIMPKTGLNRVYALLQQAYPVALFT